MRDAQERPRTVSELNQAYSVAAYAVIAFLRGWEEFTPPSTFDPASLRQQLTWVIAGNLAALKGCRDSDPDLRRIDIPLYAAALSEKHNLPKLETVAVSVEVINEVDALLRRDTVWALVTATAYQLLGEPKFSEAELAELGKQLKLERLHP